MRLFITFLFLFVIALPVKPQNLIGYHKPDIIKIMKEKQSVYSLDNQAINPVYNYLKYVDALGNRTLLFFLSEEDICTHFKLMSDYAYFKSTRKRMDEKFKRINDSIWVQRINKKDYIKKLKKGEWFFTVTTRLKEK